MYDLNGKVALVTGTSNRHGIGQSIALRLAREGADVVVTDKYIAPENIPIWDREEGWYGIDSLAMEIEAMGRRALAVTADVTNSQEVNAMVEKALQKFGKIDILVNNAGMSFGAIGSIPILEMSEETWNRPIAVNTTGAFRVCQAVLRNMIPRQTGKIIIIASLDGKQGCAFRASYNASKFGVIGLTQSLALEVAPYHINVNAVCPGTIASWASKGGRQKLHEAMKQGLSEEEAASKIYSKHNFPMGRPGKPEDIANMVAFLASSQSDYVTGQSINVCGGIMVAH